ncbi:hypothetical protein [Bacteroides sp. An19]|uniref:Imm43 family immunity protein n=1 Tax=Bacteroides sp. An19 TaxID=1965580 RepID=UPI000B36A1E0|nr:hypothetical protein [Bacteroides sp. An19]OUP36208.1 hypothetical protein B5F25_03390 [Bacteroides sp. An19]
MNNLFIWFNRTKMPIGYPNKNDFIIKSTFDKNKPKYIPNQIWKLYSLSMGNPSQSKYKFPTDLYMVITNKSYKEIYFDYYGYDYNIAFISDQFFDFIRNNGLPDSYYEIAELHILNLDGIYLTNNKYKAIRFIKSDDLLFDFDINTQKRAAGVKHFLYPNLKLIKKVTNKKIYYISQFCYNESIIFDLDIKNNIISNFKHPQIYKISDFPYIYNNQYKWDILPFDNTFLINK